jgi:hypothetical protein
MTACMKEPNGENWKIEEIVLFHKVNYNKTPQYLAEVIPKNVGTRNSHNTRKINNIVNIICQTSLYSEYFLSSI